MWGSLKAPLTGQLPEPMVRGKAPRDPSLVFLQREVAMEDLGENTTVLSTLRSLNSFISQRVEGGSGLDVSAPAQGSLQMQYQQSMQVSGPCPLGASRQGPCPG